MDMRSSNTAVFGTGKTSECRRSCVKGSGGAVTSDFWSYFGTAEGVVHCRPTFLFRDMTGLKHVGIPAKVWVACTTSEQKRRQQKQNIAVHHFDPVSSATLPIILENYASQVKGNSELHIVEP